MACFLRRPQPMCTLLNVTATGCITLTLAWNLADQVQVERYKVANTAAVLHWMTPQCSGSLLSLVLPLSQYALTNHGGTPPRAHQHNDTQAHPHHDDTYMHQILCPHISPSLLSRKEAPNSAAPPSSPGCPAGAEVDAIWVCLRV
jgi:hypothetical protein